MPAASASVAAITAESSEPVAELLLIHLHNYLYRKWFRPYRSDIEYGQFLTKVIFPKPTSLPDKTCSQYTVDLIRALNANICARVDQAQDTIKALKDLDPEKYPFRIGLTLNGCGWREDAKVIRDQDFYILQPLFHAIAVIIQGKYYTMDTSDPGSLPVLIVRTGVEAGLSSPITFDSITKKSQEERLIRRGEGDISRRDLLGDSS